MDCRAGCAACCIVVSISSPIPGMPEGKLAGVRCVQLTPDNLCALFNKSERPMICLNFNPDPAMCGEDNEYAYKFLAELEFKTCAGR